MEQSHSDSVIENLGIQHWSCEGPGVFSRQFSEHHFDLNPNLKNCENVYGATNVP